MRKILLTFSLFVMTAVAVNAHDYNTGIGVRGGFSNGLTVKHFIGSNSALEAFVASRWRGFNITGLYEIHAQAFGVPRLHWYYGGGGHIGFWNGGKNHPWFDEGDSHSVIGIDGILGMEYNIQEIPFNISLDWKPAFNLIGYTGFWGDEIALSIRFIF